MRHTPVFSTVILLLIALMLSGCGSDEESVRVDFSKRAELSVPVQKDAITYAYLPQYSHAISYGRHKLLLDYLRDTTGLPFRQVYPDTFDEHVEMVKRGEIDISFSNPLIYLQLAETGARAFARIIEPSGQPYFSGEIICRADSDIKNLQDCRGKRWIAVDRSSAGGFLYPLGMFMDHGLTPDDFPVIEFAPGPGGKQEKVVLAVFAGAFDIGSIRQGTLDLLKDKIDLARIRVLRRTRPYPSWVYAYRKGFPTEQARRIAEALFALSIKRPDDAIILNTARMRGIIPARDSDYDPVRELVARIHEQDGGLLP